MVLTKARLADALHEALELSKREAFAFVVGFFDEIIDELGRGRNVKLERFGVFCLLDKPRRPGRNPRTGEPIPVSARRVVTFRASHHLKALTRQLG